MGQQVCEHKECLVIYSSYACPLCVVMEERDKAETATDVSDQEILDLENELAEANSKVADLTDQVETADEVIADLREQIARLEEEVV